MDKKDIYEHLASIYLDASSKKKRKKQPIFGASTNIIIAVCVFTLGFIAAFSVNLIRFRAPKSELALVLAPGPVKINFNFDPAKKESFTLFLNNLNLTKYHALGFNAKKLHTSDTITLRVEFTNIYKEKSEMYVRDIPVKWSEYKIPFGMFRAISDWAEMDSVSFTVEEWNAKEKKGVLYIDNIRVLK